MDEKTERTLINPENKTVWTAPLMSRLGHLKKEIVPEYYGLTHALSVDEVNAMHQRAKHWLQSPLADKNHKKMAKDMMRLIDYVLINVDGIENGPWLEEDGL